MLTSIYAYFHLVLTSGCFIPAVPLLVLIASEEDYRRAVEMFFTFCFE